MDTAIITWLSVLTLVFIVFVGKMFVLVKHRTHMMPVRVSSHHHRHHVVDLSNEREMLFIPGDNVRANGYDNDCNADDNYC